MASTISESALAPIVIFAFNRPQMLDKLRQSLATNPEIANSDLYIFVDGPRAGREGEAELVAQSVEVAKSFDGYRSVTVKASEANRGLAPSVIAGVTEVMDRHGRAIVLEDDLILTPNFLSFHNQMLDRYADDPRVFQISGFGLKVKPPKDYPYDVYCHYRAYSQGWSTWRDRWQSVDWGTDYYYEMVKDPAKRKAFNRGGSDLFDMLDCYVHHRNSSWYIRFDYAMHHQGKLCVIPINSLVYNEGWGVESTNTSGFNRYKITLSDGKKTDFACPDVIEATEKISKQVNSRYSIPFRVYCKVVDKSIALYRKIVK